MVNMIGCVKKTLSLTHPEYHSSRAEKGIMQVEGKVVISVRERVEQMEWRESGSRQVESVGESGKSGESGVSGGHSSKVESMESGGVSGESGVSSTVESMESGGVSGESGGSREVGCLSRLKCRTNSLLSLTHPKFFKAKQVRRPVSKLNLPKQSESQIAANINFL